MTTTTGSSAGALTASSCKSKPASKSTAPRSTKWTRAIRALPSDTDSKDYLKTDYIDVNLNNSRKLIENLSKLLETTETNVRLSTDLNKTLADLNTVRANLAWLDDI